MVVSANVGFCLWVATEYEHFLQAVVLLFLYATYNKVKDAA